MVASKTTGRAAISHAGFDFDLDRFDESGAVGAYKID